jgi:hypothetical protein
VKSLSKVAQIWKKEKHEKSEILDTLDVVIDALDNCFKNAEANGNEVEPKYDGISKFFIILISTMECHRSDTYFQSVIQKIEKFLDITSNVPTELRYGKQYGNVAKCFHKKLKQATTYKTQEKIVGLWTQFLADIGAINSKQAMGGIKFHNNEKIETTLKYDFYAIKSHDFVKVI